MSAEAAKTFRKLDRPLQKRIAVLVDRIESSVNPRFSGKALQGNDREWRYRVGDYRLDRELRSPQRNLPLSFEMMSRLIGRHRFDSQ